MSDRSRGRRLLVRDLAQLATPSDTEAPLRGAVLGSLDVVEDAYILCEDGRIAAAGAMSDLGTLDDEVEELDGRGLDAILGEDGCGGGGRARDNEAEVIFLVLADSGVQGRESVT